MIRVLIVDEQDEVRWGLRMRLDIEPDVAIVGEAGTAADALNLAQTLAPDAIVVDIAMHGAGAADLIGQLRALVPEAAVVVLTLRGDEYTRAQARAAGAQMFLEKRGGAAELLHAIRLLAARSLLAASPTAGPRLEREQNPDAYVWNDVDSRRASAETQLLEGV